MRVGWLAVLQLLTRRTFDPLPGTRSWVLSGHAFALWMGIVYDRDMAKPVSAVRVAFSEGELVGLDSLRGDFKLNGVSRSDVVRRIVMLAVREKVKLKRWAKKTNAQQQEKWSAQLQDRLRPGNA